METAEAENDAGEAIDMQEILKRIPHRYPFLLVDRAIAYRAHTSLIGVKCVTANEPYFQGHFPGEALGQTGGILMSKSLNADVTGKTIFFASVDGCRFRAPVRPGDVLFLHVDVLRYRGDLYKFRGQARVNEKLAAECEFAAMVVENR
jgi:3-hydroxyacyl-[acyl-carrier-protein] dehydratase